MRPGQVRDALGGDLAYTTVLTVLSRLFEKGEIVREAAGRGYAYSAPYDSAALTARRMAQLLKDGDRATVLTRFVDGLSPGDEQLLRSLLDR
jgi:predicted transcriptional regulator